MLALLLLASCADWVCLPEGSPGAGLVYDVEVPDLSAQTRLRHHSWDAVLRLETLDEDIGGLVRRVDYDHLVTDAEAWKALEDSLSTYAGVDPSALESHEEQLAYWINAYNAWVLYAVAAAYAQDPAYNVEADGFLIFTTPFIQVGEWTLSPNDVEHGIARGYEEQAYADEATRAQAERWHDELWGDRAIDGRIHMGFNCASASCPSLSPGALQGSRLYEQLDELSRLYVANTAYGAGPQGISTIFNWYAADFAPVFGSVQAFIEEYREGGTADVDFGTFLTYDWSLNAASRPSGEDETCASPW